MATNFSPPTLPYDFTAGPLAERAFPELAGALQSSAGKILQEWAKLVREHVDPAKAVTFEEVLDGLPRVFSGMADALASGNPAEVAGHMDHSPPKGVSRLHILYNVREIATDTRMLRRLIIEQVEVALGSPRIQQMNNSVQLIEALCSE